MARRHATSPPHLAQVGDTLPVVEVRRATAIDAAFLRRMLDLAFNWRAEAASTSVGPMMDRPEIAHYVTAWPRKGDLGLIAQDEEPVGAAWWRYFPAHDPGYGFVDALTPEISIGVAHGSRDLGVGTLLLRSLIAEARILSLPALSLSVAPDNPALRLYRRLGFRITGTRGGSHTMVLDLAPAG